MADLAVHEPVADYAVEIRIRNARILGLMRRAGITTATELARRAKTANQLVGQLINLKMSPLLPSTGEYLPAVLRIADALYCLPDDMFTDRQRHTFLASNKRCVEMSEAEVEGQLATLAQLPLEEHIFQLEQKRAVRKALDVLTPRERTVIVARFGLDGGGVRTLDQTAEEIPYAEDGLAPSRERVRQLEARAMRKLARPVTGLHLVADVPDQSEKKLDTVAFIAHQRGLKEQAEKMKRWTEEAQQRQEALWQAAPQPQPTPQPYRPPPYQAPPASRQEETRRIQEQFALYDAIARWRAGGPAVNPLDWMTG